MRVHRSRYSLAIHLMALPAAVLFAIARNLWAARNALRTRMRCRHCGNEMALVRAWRCGCGHTFVGSVLRKCEVCGSRPLVIRCNDCGLTWRIR